MCKNKERNFVSRQNYELRKRPRKSREIRDPYKESCTELWTSSSVSSSSSSSIGLGTAFFFFFSWDRRWYGFGGWFLIWAMGLVTRVSGMAYYPFGFWIGSPCTLEFDEVHSTLLNPNPISSCSTC